MNGSDVALEALERDLHDDAASVETQYGSLEVDDGAGGGLLPHPGPLLGLRHKRRPAPDRAADGVAGRDAAEPLGRMVHVEDPAVLLDVEDGLRGVIDGELALARLLGVAPLAAAQLGALDGPRARPARGAPGCP